MGRLVIGRGNPESRILLLGEKPGHEELKRGKVFVGHTGVEFDKICWKTGLKPEECWLDNLLQDAPTGDDWSVTKADLDRNKAHIDDLIFGRFDKIVTMGQVATRYLLNVDDEFDVRADINTVHGIKHELSWCEIMPTYHPAAGFHDPDAYPYIFTDFKIAADWIRGNWAGPDRVDRVEVPRYTPLTDSDRDLRLLEALFERNEYTHIFVDTEGSVRKPWCLTFALEEGEGYCIQAKHRIAVGRLAEEVRRRGIVAVLHYAPHDIPVLREMGWRLVEDRIRILDTMVAAYLLQIEPQGLKALAYRHCGMIMSDYLDIVREKTLEKRIEWLVEVGDVDWGKPEPIIEEKKTETKLTQPQGLNRRIEKILADLEKDPTTDLWDRWKLIHKSVREPAEMVFGKLPVADLDDVPFEVAFRYACRDADATGRAFWRLIDRLVNMDLLDTFYMDCAIIPHIEEMMTTGFRAKADYFRALSVEWRGEQGKIRKQLADKIGYFINPESQPQVSELLFTKLKLPAYKMTEGGGYSTADKAIDWLKTSPIISEDSREVVQLVGRHREYDKGCSSFADPIEEYAREDPDERLHGNIKYTRVVSGRLSMAEPNLLAMPVRTDIGKRVRGGFVAGDGRLIGSWDLNQIEMRFMAHESEDPDLIKAYEDNKDIHKETASRMFGCRAEDVSPEQREVAKRVGFGVITGITGLGLKDQFYLNGITKYGSAECDEFIRIWFDARRGVKDYLERCKAEARQHGYARESVGGRIRFLQGIQSTNKKVAAEAERASHSHKISSGAQAIIKKGMDAAWGPIDELRRMDEVWIRWILQVHDEVILEFPEGYEEVIDAIIVDALCNTVKLRVPILAKGKWAKTWGELK